MVDIAAIGFVSSKTTEEMKEIIETLAKNSLSKVRGGRSRVTLNEVHTSPDLASQVADLSRKMTMLVNQDTSNREACYQCGIYGHLSNACMNVDSHLNYYEDVNCMGAYRGR